MTDDIQREARDWLDRIYSAAPFDEDDRKVNAYIAGMNVADYDRVRELLAENEQLEADLVIGYRQREEWQRCYSLEAQACWEAQAWAAWFAAERDYWIRYARDLIIDGEGRS